MMPCLTSLCLLHILNCTYCGSVVCIPRHEFVILMFLPATASIKRLLTPLAPWPIVILPPSPHLTKALNLINTDNHACTGIHSLPYRMNRNPHTCIGHTYIVYIQKRVNEVSYTYSQTHTHTPYSEDIYT
ncbi:hypothetical protein PAMP_022232 [Pampus punctatissimus]